MANLAEIKGGIADLTLFAPAASLGVDSHTQPLGRSRFGSVLGMGVLSIGLTVAAGVGGNLMAPAESAHAQVVSTGFGQPERKSFCFPSVGSCVYDGMALLYVDVQNSQYAGYLSKMIPTVPPSDVSVPTPGKELGPFTRRQASAQMPNLTLDLAHTNGGVIGFDESSRIVFASGSTWTLWEQPGVAGVQFAPVSFTPELTGGDDSPIALGTMVKLPVPPTVAPSSSTPSASGEKVFHLNERGAITASCGEVHNGQKVKLDTGKEVFISMPGCP